jgi:hypothetical protein
MVGGAHFHATVTVLTGPVKMMEALGLFEQLSIVFGIAMVTCFD